MTEQEPLNFRQIATTITMLGFASSVVATAWTYFLARNTLYDSMRYGIASGISIAGYTATLCFFPPGKEYIDDRTETDN